MAYKRPAKRTPHAKKTAIVNSSAAREDALFARVVEIIEAARGYVARSVNTAMVQAYWRIGREIVEVEQRGAKRAGYGERLIEGLAQRLRMRVGKGFSVPNLRNMRQFYLTYRDGSALPEATLAQKNRSAPSSDSTSREIRSAAPSESLSVFPPYLGWTHYLLLMRVANPMARAFYEIEAARESWSSRELERLIGSLLFERLAKSRDKDKVLGLARRDIRSTTRCSVSSSMPASSTIRRSSPVRCTGGSRGRRSPRIACRGGVHTPSSIRRAC